MRIAVASVQVPFITGGAEILAQGLLAALRRAGHQVDLVTLPFRFFPPAEVTRAMQVWESENFGAFNLYEPDLVVCLKFPAYGLAHSRKTAWLLHQHKSGHASGLSANDGEGALHEATVAFDRRHLADCRRFALSRHVAQALARSTGLAADVLYHPPHAADAFYAGHALDYILVPSRLEDSKRQALLIRAMAHVRAPVGALVAGTGGQHAALRSLIGTLGLGSRVRLLGQVSHDDLRALYARALGVFFGPQDEDYGYVTLEAMLAHKPVITCTDSGGPLEFVEDGITGAIVAPEPEAIAEAIDTLWADRARARRLGENAHERYRALDLRWDRVAQALTADP